MLFSGCSGEGGDDQGNPPGLPWDITVAVDGTTTVFGLTPGKSLLADAPAMLGNESEIAIIKPKDGLPSLEMYFSRYRVGMISGKLVLQGDVEQSEIADWQSRAYRESVMPSGTARKLQLQPDDQLAALQATIHAITFLPAVNLDDEIVKGRFGEPSQMIQSAEGVTHYLYADKGIDVVVSEDSKDVIQYVAPQDFDQLLAPLQKDDQS
ncbi:MAG: hypothetical protein ACWA5Q_05740 [bacterium]